MDEISIHLTAAEREKLDHVTAQTGMTVDQLVSSQLEHKYQRNHGARISGDVIDGRSRFAGRK